MSVWSIGNYHYTVMQWLFLFYFYCFCGWCIESAYVSIKSKQLVNRGFMRGPFLPLYGSGGIMMLVVSAPFQDNIVLVYIAGCIGASILEYITGITMEALFKVRYWDYSDQPFNFQGQICLGTSLSWGLLTILMTEFVHKPVEKLMLMIPFRILVPVTAVLTVLIAADFALSCKAALDIRDILVKMEKAKEELERISKRLDVIVALANEERENRKVERNGRLESLKSGLEERFENIKAVIKAKPGEYRESEKEEIFSLREKFHINLELTRQLKSVKDFYKRGMLRGNPTMVSGKFREALEELKETVSGKWKENEKDNK